MNKDTLIVFKSLGGNVRKFVRRLEYSSFEINGDNIYSYKHTGDFVLIVPTYESYMLDDVLDFMEDNHEHCIGIVGSGNYNFADLYIFTAKDLSKQYNIPLIYDFENSGNNKDVENVKEKIKGL